MKTMCKRMLAVFLCVLLCGMTPFSTFAAQVTPDEAPGETEPVDLPDDFDFNIVRYRSFLVVPDGTKLTFHTTADAPEGYCISWSVDNSSGGSECVFTSEKGQKYKVSADLVRQSDGAVVRSTKTETVYVASGPVIDWCAKFYLVLCYIFYNSLGGPNVRYSCYYNCEDNRVEVCVYTTWIGFLP